MWQPLGRVAPGSRLIAKRCLGAPARPVTFCGTEAVARWQAASARNPLMGKPFLLLLAVWHRLCFSLEDRRGRSGVRPHPSRQAAYPRWHRPPSGWDTRGCWSRASTRAIGLMLPPLVAAEPVQAALVESMDWRDLPPYTVRGWRSKS